jgi:NADH-quinone oxidoreductase subunit E
VLEDTLVSTQQTVDLALMDEVLNQYQDEQGAVIPVLQRAQAIYGYLPAEVLQHIARRTGVPLSQVYGVATFYAQFYLTKRGRNSVRCCDGTACHVRGSARILSTLENSIGIKAGETTPDYRVTLEVVYCLGACGLSPVAVINNQVIGRLVPEKIVELVRELK